MTRFQDTIRCLIVFLIFFADGQAAAAPGTSTPPAIPRRIVSLAPNLTEILFALRVPLGQIAGVTDYCNYPPAARTRPRVGGLIDWSAEKVLSLRPDLVLALQSGDLRQRVLALAQSGPAVMILKIDRWPELLAALETIGRRLSRGQEARRLIRELTRRLPPPWPTGQVPPRVAVLVSLDPLIPAGGETFIDDMIRLAGGENAFAPQRGFSSLAKEAFMAAAPQVLILALAGGTTLKTAEEARWHALGWSPRIAAVDPDLFARPGPRAIEGILWLRRQLQEGKR